MSPIPNEKILNTLLIEGRKMIIVAQKTEHSGRNNDKQTRDGIVIAYILY